MTLSIRDREAERLAREQAADEGLPITEVVLDALRRRAQAKAERASEKRRKLDALVADLDSRPRRPTMTAEEFDDYLYDENGLPH